MCQDFFETKPKDKASTSVSESLTDDKFIIFMFFYILVYVRYRSRLVCIVLLLSCKGFTKKEGCCNLGILVPSPGMLN